MEIDQERKLTEWRNFFSQCMKSALDFTTFQKRLELHASRVPSDGVRILEAWALAHADGLGIMARLMRYFELMLQSHVISDDDALKFVLGKMQHTIAEPDQYLIKSGSAQGEWKPTIEAAILERIAYQMVNFRASTVEAGDRLPDLRMFKPLIALVSIFTTLATSHTTLNGPALEIGTELGKLVVAYMNDLSLVGLANCDNGRPPKGRCPSIYWTKLNENSFSKSL
jgi:hypothetical protein